MDISQIISSAVERLGNTYPLGRHGTDVKPINADDRYSLEKFFKKQLGHKENTEGHEKGAFHKSTLHYLSDKKKKRITKVEREIMMAALFQSLQRVYLYVWIMAVDERENQ